MNNLTGGSRRSPRRCTVSANGTACQLIRNGRYEVTDCELSPFNSQEVSDLWRATLTSPVNISKCFTFQEFAVALKHPKPGKAPGPHSICPGLIIHAGAALKSWLCGFLSSSLHHLKIPNVWRTALVVAVPKPKKPVEDPKSYPPDSLVCVPYKILKKFIHSRVEPIVHSLLPREQAGLRQGRSTLDPTVLLSHNIEGSFEAKKKAGAVFVNLTAAYDTVWHRGLT